MNQPPLQPLLQPLTIVGGKGGVGRSTTAAALALNAAEQGANVLAVDIVDDGGLRAALGADRDQVELLELTTEASLDEYVTRFLRVPIPPSRLGPIARIFDYVATAAPGVREILTIGKVAFEVRERNWDFVVVDAPATGHLIELLTAPDTLREMISVGPLAEQTAWMSTLLGDPDITGLVMVSTAEALPVSESLEFLDRLAETNVSPSGLVVNRVPDLLDPAGFDEAKRLRKSRKAADRALVAAIRVVADRAANAIVQIERLHGLDLPLTWVGESDDPVGATRAALREIE